jgi:uncharacterized protein
MAREIEVVKKFYQELDNSNVQGAVELLDSEFRLIQAESLPYGGEYRGIAGVQDFFSKFFAFWKSFKSENVQYSSIGETVFAHSVASAVTVENQKIEMPMIQMYVVRNEKLVLAQPFYFDTAKINQLKP